MLKCLFFLAIIVLSRSGFAITGEFAAAAECMGYKNAQHMALNGGSDVISSSSKSALSKVEQQILFLYKKFQKDFDEDEAGNKVVFKLFAEKPMNSYAELLNSISSCKDYSEINKQKECKKKLINEWLAAVNKACEFPLKEFK